MSYITFQGYGIEFGYLSFKKIMMDKNRNIMIDSNGSPNDLGVSKIIYSGYQNYCVNHEIEIALSFDEFCRVIDKAAQTKKGIDEIQNIIQAWAESSDIRDLVKQNESNKSEKKNQK